MKRPPSGSIPARAGEPISLRSSAPPKWVYPRACGGTVFLLTKSARYFGLSPRVRGNPYSAPQRQARKGSIPARAGEPKALFALEPH